MRRILFVSAILLLAACGAGAQQITTDQCTFLNSAQAAFCDAFETIHAGGRAGDLDPTKWAFYRISSNNNPFQGNVLTFYPTTAMFCEELKDGVVPDRDSFVCGEQFGRPNYWLTALNDAGAQAWLGPRALQPFDFAGRTGTVEWNVDAKTAGSHTYWTEFWIADEPAPAAHSSNGAGRGFMPRNGIGINFGGLACVQGQPAGTTLTDSTKSTGGVEEIIIVRNYQETTLEYQSDPNSCYAVQPDRANHFEVRLSQNRLELWAADANPQEDSATPGPNFRRILSADNLNLSFTRGFVYFQHVQYNAAKEGVTPMQTYHWHAIGFDGPVLPAQRDYPVPDALLPSPDGGINLGYLLSTSGLSFQVGGVDLANASSASLTLNFAYLDNPTTIQLQYRLNGHSWKTFVDPKHTDGYGFGGAVMPVDLAELVSGTNTIDILPVNEQAVLANIDLLVDVAPGDQPPPPAPVPPVLSNVQAGSVTTNSATITWNTDQSADGQILYGTSSSYGFSTAAASALTTLHSATLSALNPATTYHYSVVSRSAEGLVATSPDQNFITLSQPQPPPAVALVGDTSVEPGVDSNSPGTAEAFQYQATSTGLAHTLNIYIDQANAAKSVVVGLYSNSSTNNPGNLLVQAVISAPVAGSWNSVNIAPTQITAQSTYWIAVLGPATTGQVQFRDRPVGGRNQISRQSTLVQLPSTWSPGTRFQNSPMSAFVSQ